MSVENKSYCLKCLNCGNEIILVDEDFKTAKEVGKITYEHCYDDTMGIYCDCGNEIYICKG